MLSFPIVMDFSPKQVLMNSHEYANELKQNVLICISDYQIKEQCLRFCLVPTLPNYVEHRLRYE